MHVKSSLSEAYSLIRANPSNFLLYFVASIALVIFSLASVLVSVVLFPLFLVMLAVMLALSVFLGAAFGRIFYLSSQGKNIPVSSESVGGLVEYAKSNAVDYLKLMLLSAAISIPFIALIALPALTYYYFVQLGNSPAIGIGLTSALSAAALAICAILAFILNTSNALFFMGSERESKVGTVRRSVALVHENILEYALFGLAILLLALAYMLVYVLLSCLGPALYLLSSAFQFFVSLAVFIFVGKLLGKGKR